MDEISILNDRERILYSYLESIPASIHTFQLKISGLEKELASVRVLMGSLLKDVESLPGKLEGLKAKRIERSVRLARILRYEIDKVRRFPLVLGKSISSQSHQVKV
jgi:hypothetical protein